MLSADFLIQNIINLCTELSELEYNSENTKKRNKMAKNVLKISKELRDGGEETIQKVVLLLDHESNDVRVQAAYILLPIEPEKAKKVLNEISQIKGRPGAPLSFNVAQLSFSAEMLLQEWEKGNIKF